VFQPLLIPPPAAGCHALDSVAQLRQRDNAQKQLFFLSVVHPGDDAGIGPGPFAILKLYWYQEGNSQIDLAGASASRMLQSSFPQRRRGEEIREGTNPLGFATPLFRAHHNDRAALPRNGLRAFRHGAVDHFAELGWSLGHGPGLRIDMAPPL
jgi:hypothetical protein